MKPERPKVVDLNKRKYAKTVLHFYDKFERLESYVASLGKGANDGQ